VGIVADGVDGSSAGWGSAGMLRTKGVMWGEIAHKAGDRGGVLGERGGGGGLVEGYAEVAEIAEGAEKREMGGMGLSSNIQPKWLVPGCP